MSMIECLRSNSAAAEASRIVKASKGVLLFLHCYNGNAAARFLQIFDSATLPADTAVPLLTIPMAATSSVTVNLAPLGLPMNAGIVVCNSTSGGTKTIGGADSVFAVGYK